MTLDRRPPREVLIELAKRYEGTHEVGGDNLGPAVEEFQRAVDKVASREPWCMCFIQYCVKETELMTGRRSLLYRSESVLEVWRKSPIALRRGGPSTGLIVLWQWAKTEKGHAGLLSHVLPEQFESIEGNTSPGPWIERNGDGVYTKIRRKPWSVGSMNLLGFLDPFG